MTDNQIKEWFDEIGINEFPWNKGTPEETTADGLFTLEGVRCLGCCSLAPVVTIGNDLYSKVKTIDVPELISKYRKEEK